MKKNNQIIYILFLVLIGSCAKNQTPKTLLGEWEKDNQKDEVVVRSLASLTNTNKCISDLFDSNTLKAEIQESESKIRGKAVNGTWRHLDLETLPIPQANFLKRFGKEIGDLANPNSIDYSTCDDLVCVFNKIYGKEKDYIAGYVHYAWYLKFGSYLSLDNKVYAQESPTPGVYNGKAHALQTYLFNEDELYGLWRITHVLDGAYTKIGSFEEVQRVPRGENLEGYKSDLVCGLAAGGSNIRLNDGCLTVAKDNKDKGFLYRGVIHEINHLMDYGQARANRYSEQYRSQKIDYTEVAGLYLAEYKKEDGKVEYKWTPKEGAKFVRDYAKTNPLENFAESLAAYRYDGDEANESLTSAHRAWISENYFNNQVFDTPSKIKRYITKYKSKHANTLFNIVLDCSVKRVTSSSIYLKASDFSGLRIDPGMLKCLSSEVEKVSQKITAEISYREIEGCSTIKSNTGRVAWPIELKSSLASDVNTYLRKIAHDPGFIDRFKEFKNTVSSFQIANEAILTCYDGKISNDKSECYKKKVDEIILLKAQDVGVPEDQISFFQELYQNSFSYNDVNDKVIQAFKSFTDANAENVRLSSERLWDQCRQEIVSDEESPKGSIYAPSNGYMISSHLNCLNVNIPDYLKDIIREITYNDNRIYHEKEELLMLEFITPKLLAFIDEKRIAATEAEVSFIIDYFKSIKESLESDMKNDFTWIKSLTLHEQNIASCRTIALDKIELLPVYHLKRDSIGRLVEINICKKMIDDEKYLEFIEQSKTQLENNVYSKLEERIYTYAKERAADCIKSIPWKWEKTKSAVKIPRKLCLAKGWNDMEESLIDELLMSEDIKRFEIPRSEITRRVEALEDMIKSKVENEFF